MKRFVILFLGLFVFILSQSCDKKKDEPDPELPFISELKVNPLSLNFSENGGEQTTSIICNSIWKIDFSDAEWVRPSISIAKGNATVNIIAEANKLEEERTAVFIISSEGAEDVFLTITQEAKSPEQKDYFEFEDYIDPDDSNMRNMSSLEFSSLMGVGWNLGNSLEAISVNNGIYSGGETSWGNAPASKELIDAVKAAGFKVLRIPVSWSHKLVNKENYLISLNWLKRVEEVVSYALENDMFVKINIHWDGGWLNYPDYAHQEEIEKKLTILWKQIAAYFRNYDDRLLFAGTNEVHVDGYYGAPTKENLEVQNSFNQIFVNVVRATGGRNHYRYLVVQGYNTNISNTFNGFLMPEDVVENRIITEVHYYDPWEFTLKEDLPYNTQWGKPFEGGDVTASGQEDWADEAFGMMKSKFIDEGIAVILGEYGASHRLNLAGEAYEKHKASREYYFEYITKTALQNKLVPIYWDNGHVGNNGSAIFNRSSGAITDQGALDAIMRGAEMAEE